MTGALFGLAIITYITHAYIRARIVKKFAIEDALLLFAVICLCGSTGVHLANVQGLYDGINVLIHSDLNSLNKVLENLPKNSRLSNTAATLWWFVIFPVKLAYLFFFRRLILRLRNLQIWWWFVVSFTIPAGFACLAVSWMICPHFSLKAINCSCNPSSPNPDSITLHSVTKTSHHQHVGEPPPAA